MKKYLILWLLFLLCFIPFEGKAQTSGSITSQAKLDVRATLREDYTRLVFDWPQKTQYTTNRDSDTLVIIFKDSKAIDISAIQNQTLPNITNIDFNTQTAGQVKVTLTIPDQSRIRDFTIGNRIILDVYNPSGGVQANATTTQAITNQDDTPDVQEPEEQISKEQTTQAQIPQDSLQDSTPEEPAPQDQETADTAQAAPTTETDSNQTNAPDNTQLANLEQESQTPPDQAGDAPADPPAIEKQLLAPPDIEAHKISISGTRAFGMAVFKRDDWLWLVIDDPNLGVPPRIDGPQKNQFGDFTRFEIQDGLAYRIRLPDKNLFVYGEGGGLTWSIVVSPYERTSKELRLEREYNDLDLVRGASLVWPTPEAKATLSFIDPAQGDTIHIATTEFSELYAGQAKDFVELSKLKSAVGLAVVSKVDDLELTRLDDKVLISRPGGLALARPLDIKAAQLEEQAEINFNAVDMEDGESDEPPMSRIYNFEGWQMGGLDSMEDNNTVLMAGLNNKNENEKITDLLTLAKLNLANSRSFEALGFLAVAVRQMPAIADAPEFIALRGAANTMAGRPDIGLQDLARSELNGIDEIGYWHAFALAGVEDWNQALQVMPRRWDVLETYPQQIKIPVSLGLAEVALRGGDILIAEFLLGELAEIIEEFEDGHPKKAEWNYLWGELERQRNNTDKAIEIWTNVKNGTDDLFRVKSSLALTRLEQELEKIKPEEVIDRLEGLRYAWRGDALETLVNYRLAQAYIEEGSYLKGLNMMRNAITLTPGTKLSEELTASLTDTFRSLFTDEVIKNVTPLDAVAVYEEFRELTPPGRAGDMMAIILADRLVSADLLGRAINILQPLVVQRLSGEDKVKTAIQLAGIQLLDGKPEGTLRNLDLADAEINTMINNGQPDLNSVYRREMSLLRARALSETGQTTPALALLGDLPPDRDVLRMKVDLAWKDSRWEDAAESLEDLIYLEDISLNRPLSEEQASLILNRSIALNLSGNRAALTGLRDRYGALMEQTSKARMFEVVTRERQTRLAASRQMLDRMIGEVDLFEDFLESYKSSIKPTN